MRWPRKTSLVAVDWAANMFRHIWREASGRESIRRSTRAGGRRVFAASTRSRHPRNGFGYVADRWLFRRRAKRPVGFRGRGSREREINLWALADRPEIEAFSPRMSLRTGP